MLGNRSTELQAAQLPYRAFSAANKAATYPKEEALHAPSIFPSHPYWTSKLDLAPLAPNNAGLSLCHILRAAE
jgi:hypothetical protein